MSKTWFLSLKRIHSSEANGRRPNCSSVWTSAVMEEELGGGALAQGSAVPVLDSSLYWWRKWGEIQNWRDIYKGVCLDFISFISILLTWFTSPRFKSNLFQLNCTNLKSLERPYRTYHSLSRKISLPHNYLSWAYPSFPAQLKWCFFYTLSDTTPSNPNRINPSNLYYLFLFYVVFRNVLTMVFTVNL